MTRISEAIQRYNDGSMSYDELYEFLLAYHYKPSAPPPSAEEIDRNHALGYDSNEYPVMGTVDEITLAVDEGRLTFDEYLPILEAIGKRILERTSVRT